MFNGPFRDSLEDVITMEQPLPFSTIAIRVRIHHSQELPLAFPAMVHSWFTAALSLIKYTWQKPSPLPSVTRKCLKNKKQS
jgi:hypothetical protein